jgi:catechol 2,3-dioxygenase-like lactoylglutathione lyase family enzyme
VTPSGILETVLYVADLERAEIFYRDVMGLTFVSKAKGRQVFFRLGNQMLLIFNPAVTVIAPLPQAKLPVPPHGATGQGHVCFKASAQEIDVWRAHLIAKGVSIEADFLWPSGGRSIYFRDPAGNCLEFAEPRIWGLDQ